MEARVTLSDVLGAMSHALDMVEGLPAGHALRSSWIALKVAREMGLEGGQVRELFYSTLLKDAGCSSNAARLCAIYGDDDHRLKRDFRTVGTSTADALRYVVSHAGPRDGLGARIARVAGILVKADSLVKDLVETRCQKGAEVARSLRLGERVAEAIACLDEHWDGRGRPDGLAGTSVPLYSRIALLAQVVEVFHAKDGPAAAEAEAVRRSGTWLDPEVVQAFRRVAADPSFWPSLEAGADSVLAMADEGETFEVTEDYLDEVAGAFAAVVDAKTPFTAGHSDRVAEVADAVAERVGMDAAARRRLRRAALLHDVGKLGVSNTILEKPGKLTEEEWVAMRSHAERSEAILSRIPPFDDAARIGGAHHERLDGKGYPRGIGGDEIGIGTRVVSVADVFDALTADRPYRKAMSVEEALAIMERDEGAAFDGACMDALRSWLVEGSFSMAA